MGAGNHYFRRIAAAYPGSVRHEIRWWQKFNYAWIRGFTWTAQVLLPKSMEHHPIYHEAQARLEGKRLGGYNQWLIEAFFDKERIVN